MISGFIAVAVHFAFKFMLHGLCACVLIFGLATSLSEVESEDDTAPHKRVMS
jgi:hypothetical protein